MPTLPMAASVLRQLGGKARDVSAHAAAKNPNTLLPLTHTCDRYFGTLLPHLAKRDETAALSGVVVPFGDHSSRTSARSSAVQQQRSLSTASSGGASGAPDGEARGGDASGGGGAASSLGGGAGGGAGARTASSGPLVTAAAAEVREGAAAGGSTRAADEEYATKLASEYDNQRQRYDHRALVRHFVSKCGGKLQQHHLRWKVIEVHSHPPSWSHCARCIQATRARGAGAEPGAGQQWGHANVTPTVWLPVPTHHGGGGASGS